jgi:hypothetical protein
VLYPYCKIRAHPSATNAWAPDRSASIELSQGWMAENAFGDADALSLLPRRRKRSKRLSGEIPSALLPTWEGWGRGKEGAGRAKQTQHAQHAEQGEQQQEQQEGEERDRGHKDSECQAPPPHVEPLSQVASAVHGAVMNGQQEAAPAAAWGCPPPEAVGGGRKAAAKAAAKASRTQRTQHPAKF